MSNKDYSTGPGQEDTQQTRYNKRKYAIPTRDMSGASSQQQPLSTAPQYPSTYATQQGYFNMAANVPSHSLPTTSAQQAQTMPMRPIMPHNANPAVYSAAFYNQQANFGQGQAQASLLHNPGPTPPFNPNPPPAPPSARFHFDPAAVWPFQKAAGILHDIHHTTAATGSVTGRQLSEGLRNIIELLEHAIQHNEGNDRLRMLQNILLQTMQKIVWYVNYHITLEEYSALLRSGGMWNFANVHLPPYSPRL